MASLVARIGDLATRIATEINAVRTSLTGYALSGHAHDHATTSAPGFMSAADKVKVDAIPAKATTANIRAQTSDATYITPKGLSDAGAFVALFNQTGTVTLDFATGSNFVLNLTGNITLAVPSNLIDGQMGVIYYVQPATSPGKTLALNASIRKAGSAPTLSTSANAIDRHSYVVRNGVLELTALEKGLS